MIAVLAAQKRSADTVPSAIRDLVDYRLAFRCATRDASDVILGAGQATRGFSASEIESSKRGVGLLLAGDPDPKAIKCYYLDDRAIAERIRNAASLRTFGGGGDRR